MIMAWLGYHSGLKGGTESGYNDGLEDKKMDKEQAVFVSSKNKSRTKNP